jgi:hypothetical protein
MIQRIQTIWLLISAISSGFLMTGGIVNFMDKAGQKYFTGFSGIYKLNESGTELITGSVPLATLIIMIPVLSVISILLFKSRRIQKVLTLILITFSLCLIILVTYYSYILIKNYDTELVPGVKMVIPLIILIAAILSYCGISKDDRLVKSYDRLR